MRFDMCKRDTPVVMRVVVAKDYNRSLARPLFNCPDCFEKKEQLKELGARGSGLRTTLPSPEPTAQSKH